MIERKIEKPTLPELKEAIHDFIETKEIEGFKLKRILLTELKSSQKSCLIQMVTLK